MTQRSLSVEMGNLERGIMSETQEIKGMSRRSFITAAASVGAVAALAGLAGCSTTAATNGAATTATKVYSGLGHLASVRGRNASYSFAYIMADAVFDGDGKVLNVYYDTLEVETPASPMPETAFSGWPGQAGYSTFDGNADVAALTAQVTGWQTKREMGDVAYGKNWSVQVGQFQDFFVGKTVDEIDAWIKTSTSDTTGKVLTGTETVQADVDKYNTLSDSDKATLTDALSGATISLTDAHGNFPGALREAYENKVEVAL
jgi:hypothetical protein